jgi:hypothetical protein
MEFPIANLMDTEHCTQWIIDHFHPNGFGCPRCGTGIEQARKFRREKGENHDDPMTHPANALRQMSDAVCQP